MSKKSSHTRIAFAGIAMAALAAPVTAVQAEENPFGFTEFGSGFQVAASGAEAKCGEAKCGGDAKPKKSSAEAKCGADKKAPEAKCGSDSSMPMDENG